MNIAWNDPESHGLPGVSEALDAAGCEPCGSDAGEAREGPAAHGPVQVDARLVAEGLGLAPAQVPAMIEDRRIATLCERGTGADAGLFRFTFYFRGQRFRLVTDAQGEPVPAPAPAPRLARPAQGA